MKKIVLSTAILLILTFCSIAVYNNYSRPDNPISLPNTQETALVKDAQGLLVPPSKKLLQNNYHVYQTFNNCGPSALSMALSYYNIKISQKELGDQLRPYQNQKGDNDDKSVTLAELAEKSKEYGFVPFHRPNGSIENIKLFITYDMPVVTRTWLKENEDIGHFRVVKGYDDTIQKLIQDDSFEGKNLKFSYDKFNTLWKKFNYEYLVLVPKDKEYIANLILGEDANENTAWEKAARNAEEMLKENPGDVYARFNLSIALYHIGQYQKAVSEFEQVESKLSARTLWYQIEPIQAYFELGNYTRVFEMTEKILNNGNRAFSELYYIRGQIYLKQDKIERAREEFEKAVFYNKNFIKAREALEKLQ